MSGSLAMASDTVSPLPRGCLVLDFDGTILDTEEPLYRSWLELWDDQAGGWTGPTGSAILAGTIVRPVVGTRGRLGRSLDPHLADRRRLRHDEIQADQRIRLGVTQWLSGAEALGVPVGVASSSPHEWVDGRLERLGIRDRFAVLVCRSEDVPAKPEPISYRLVCERLGAEPARSVAVEDSPHGVAAAVAAGLYTVAVPHSLTRDLDLRRADVVVDSLLELSVAEALEHAAKRKVAGSKLNGR